MYNFLFCNIMNISNIYYINLDNRPDRRTHIEKQMNGLKWNANRFSAIKHNIGSIGCTLSHLSLLKYAKHNNLDYIIILEDDVLFLNPNLFLNSLHKVLDCSIEFDVLLFAGNNVGPYTKINENCVKITQCKTTTAYLVKNHYYDTLINNYETGLGLFTKYPNMPYRYAIDMYWSILQKKDMWLLLTPLSVVQKPDVSNIEHKYTNYTKVMLKLDK